MGGPRTGTLEVAAEQATARGAHGVVLAAAPLAAALGAEAMREGGNAFDGAVAAALVECVMLPSKCGLGGDLVAISLCAGVAEPRALLAIGEAAAGLGQAVRSNGLETTGPLSIGVPGAPAGYAALAAEGRLPLGRLVAPAIEVAQGGFSWPGINHTLSVESLDLVRANNEASNRYFPEWEPLPAHGLVTLPGLAELLAEFSVRGASLFSSPIGELVSAYVTEKGGVLSSGDFAAGHAEWLTPAVGRTMGRVLWATPAPTHGLTLIEALTVSQAPRSTGAVWDLVQVGLGARAGLSDPSGTSMVSAADSDGNAVVVVHSNSFPRFGSGLVVPEYDLILNNRAGRGFSPDPDSPNFPAPGRRPATTLHAWALSDETGKPALLGATPGGENQMVWNTQFVAQALTGERDPGVLVVSPRWELGPGGEVRIEEGFDSRSVAELAGRASKVVHLPRWDLHSAQQVLIAPVPGEVIVGAVDPRTGGAGVAV